MNRISTVLLLVGGILCGAVADDASYVCKRTTGKIKIDGKVNEEAWKSAVVITKFNPYKTSNPEPLPGMKARMLWDDKTLYVAIECDDTDVWSFPKKKDDTTFYLGDVAELFVRPNPDSKFHYELVCPPNGKIFDACFPSRGAGAEFRCHEWDSGMKVKAVVNGTDGDWKDTDEGYTVEMAIPFSCFADCGVDAPSKGWTFAVCRYEYAAGREQACLMTTMPSDGKGFHVYEAYSPLIFSE